MFTPRSINNVTSYGYSKKTRFIALTLFPLRISLATMLARRPNICPRPSITIALGENPGISENINLNEFY